MREGAISNEYRVSRSRNLGVVPVTEIRHLAVQRKKIKIENVTSEIFPGISTTGAQYGMRFGSAPRRVAPPEPRKIDFYSFECDDTQF